MEACWHRHLGVYGICYDEEREALLVVEKAGGPYRGRYDLPGGSVDPGEGMLEALQREFLEETGMPVTVQQNLGAYDFVVPHLLKDTTHLYHIAVFYEATLAEEEASVGSIEQVLQKGGALELNDSFGLEWVHLGELEEANTSPLVRKALEWIESGRMSSETVVYESWTVLQ
ncbi:NUDIX hydrolase [Tumebacillus algifaecis]|nr:NUDIX hydrolase [Tumebacillus algifaecis]